MHSYNLGNIPSLAIFTIRTDKCHGTLRNHPAFIEGVDDQNDDPDLLFAIVGKKISPTSRTHALETGDVILYLYPNLAVINPFRQG
jgi:hypothetical protein